MCRKTMGEAVSPYQSHPPFNQVAIGWLWKFDEYLFLGPPCILVITWAALRASSPLPKRVTQYSFKTSRDTIESYGRLFPTFQRSLWFISSIRGRATEVVVNVSHGSLYYLWRVEHQFVACFCHTKVPERSSLKAESVKLASGQS